jgi:hypothetical protein
VTWLCVTILQSGFMKAAALLVVAVTAMAALAGCGPAPSSPPSSSPSSTPTPTPEPDLVPPRVVITATDVQLFGEDGTLATTFTYFDATDSAVAALTEQFGADPVVTTTPGRCCEEFPATHYDWGGLELYDSEQVVSEPSSQEFSVFVTADEIGGVVVETLDGIAVGDAASDVAATHPGAESRETYDGVERQWFTIGEVSLGVSPDWLDELIVSVSLSTDHPDGSISKISAPGFNQGV